jgi:hypothetical protein
MGQIAERGNVDASGTGLSAIVVTELLLSQHFQVSDIQSVLFLLGACILIFFLHDSRYFLSFCQGRNLKEGKGYRDLHPYAYKPAKQNYKLESH